MSNQSVSPTTKSASPTGRVLVAVWLGLLALTALTVGMASLDLGKASILAVLGIASLKFGLVLAFFMHLRYEKVRLYLGLFLIAVAALAIFLGLVLADILAR